MIIITEVKTIKVDRDPYEILSDVRYFNDLPEVWPCKGEGPIDATYFSGLVRGMCWLDKDGEEIIVGVSGEAEKILNLGYAIIDNLQKEVSTKSSTIQMLMHQTQDQITTITNLRGVSFWQRLKCVLTGVDI